MPYKSILQRWAAAVCAVVCLLVMFAAPMQAQVVISQVYGGGGNVGATYKNDFIELFNPTSSAVSLNGWSVQYASYNGTSWSNRTNLSGTILPGGYYLVQEAAGSGGTVNLPTPDATGSIAMAAGAGKVALVSNTTLLTGACPTVGVVDFVGFGSTATCFEGSGPTATLSNSNAALRNGNGCVDTNVNAADFTVGAPNPRNSAAAAYTCPVGPVPTNPTGTATAFPTTAAPGSLVLVSVSVKPGTNPDSSGLTVTADLSSLGGSATESLYDNGTNGDQNADDGTFSFLLTVPAAAASSSKTVQFTITDEQSRTGNAAASFSVTAAAPSPIPIHDVEGTGLFSPVQGQKVSVVGIVTAINSDGFFLEAPDSEQDADSATSEAVYVYRPGGVLPGVAIGNSVEVTGTVSEYPSPLTTNLSNTEIGGTVTVILFSTGNALPTPLLLTASAFGVPAARTKLEGFESMLVHADSLTSVGPTGGSTTTDGAFYAVLSGTARPFREPGMVAAAIPAGMACDVAPADACIPIFDDNQERLAVDTSRLASPLEISTGTTIGNVTGVLDAGSFTLLVPSDAALNVGTSPMTPLPVGVPGEREFTVATFNMLNFGSSGVTADRVTKAAAVVRDMMHLPDILGVEEMKDLTTLQLLADAVNAGAPDPKPVYVPYIGTIGGSQRVGFLVNSARVQVLSVTQVGADAKFIGPTSSNPNAAVLQTMFDRAPLVLRATVTPPVGQPYAVTVIVNHLRSFIDIEDSTAGPFVRAKRQACAEYLATYIGSLQLGGERVVTVGDFNAYQFNDGYVDVVGAMMGTPATIGQAILTSPDLIDTDLVDLVNTVSDADRYSYVEEGNAQAIDHILVTSNLLPARLEYARVDADFPASYLNRSDRTERVSDHDPAVAYFTFPPPQAELAATIGVGATTVVSGQGQTYTIALTNNGPDPAANPSFSDTIPAHTNFQALSAPAGWSCTTPGIGGVGQVSCTASSLAAGESAQFTLTVALDCAVAAGATISNSVAATNDYDDANLGNNSASASFVVANPAPVLGAVTVDKPVLSPPNHKLVAVFLDYSLTDNCGVPDVTVAVSSNQPLNGNGDGNTESDWQVIDAHHVLLRAERAPTSSAGRTYTITVTATDSAGDASSRSAGVSVPR